MPRCPSCFELLSYVKEGPIVVRKTCPSCFGVWIERMRLLRMARGMVGTDDATATPESENPNAPASADPSKGASLQDLVAVVAEADTKKALDCPECHATMELQRLHPMIPVDLQSCRRCGSDWLDVGKLELITRLYRELLISTDARIVALREKYALASLGLEQLRERDEATMQNMGRMGQSLGTAMGLAQVGNLLSLDGLVGALINV